MSAKIRKLSGAWWVVTHFQGKRRKKRIGPTKADKRKAEKIADEINARLAVGTFRPDPPEEVALPFDRYATAWLRSEVQLPLIRRVAGALAPATASLHERHVRLYLAPFLGALDIRGIRVAQVQALYDRCLETGRPPSERSIDMVLGTLRRILAYAEAREEIGRNPVEVWKRSRGRRRRSMGSRLDSQNVLSSDELHEVLAAARETAPGYFPMILFLADTGARLGEVSALRWSDIDLDVGSARIERSFSDGRHLGPTKTGHSRNVELSQRLRVELARVAPDVFSEDALAFTNRSGGFINPHNFRRRVIKVIASGCFGEERRFTPHGFRHTFASLHMARGTPLKWIQSQGGWASAKVLLDTYGHFLPTETFGHANALTSAPERPQTAPADKPARREVRGIRKSRAGRRGYVAPRAGLEPATRCLEGSRSIQLSYRGVGEG